MAPSPKRLELQTLLEVVQGNSNVWFQAPPNNKMSYPGIVYTHDNAKNLFADNLPYSRAKRYLVTHISRDPDTPTPDIIAMLPLCTFNRAFVADNLHHFVFTLYF